MREEKFVKSVRKVGKKTIEVEYLDIAASFDIETTSWIEDKNGRVVSAKEFNEAKRKEKDTYKHLATMYVWTSDLNDKITIGRTWQEFKEYVSGIVEKYDLNEKRRLIIWVHNLGFDSEFFRKMFEWVEDENLCVDKYKPAVLVAKCGIEFRCLYLYTNNALKNIELFNSDAHKMVGDLDYNLLRHSFTPLSEKELNYAIQDCVVINKKVEEDCAIWRNVHNFPATSTGRVRRYFAEKLSGNENFYNKMSKMKLSYEEYVLHRKAFQGGFTHASWFNFDDICEGVKHIDIASSYPAVLCLMKEYPTGKGTKINVKDNKRVKKALEKEAWVARVIIKNLKSKFKYEAIISESHNWAKAPASTFNGRIFECEEVDTYINNIDFESINQFYNYDEIKFVEMFAYSKGYLPKEIIEIVLDLYENKTLLKGVEGKEREYAIAKSYINSIYGMIATDIMRNITLFDGDYEVINKGKVMNKVDYFEEEYNVDTKTLVNKINNYNYSNKRFLSYTWATFITALARRAVFSAILASGENYIYTDTDSIFFYENEKTEKYVETYNKYIEMLAVSASMELGISENRFKPLNKLIGTWEYEKAPAYFRTLGAKRYCEVFDDESVKITVAGVSKVSGSKYLQENFKGKNEYGFPNAIVNFNKDLIFDEEASGRKISYRFENIEGELEDYLGNKAKYKELSGVSLCATRYELDGLSSLFRYIEVHNVI